MAVDEAVSRDDTNRSTLRKDIEQCGLTSTRLAHQRGKFARRNVTRHVVQQASRLAVSNGYLVTKMMPGEKILHRRRLFQCTSTAGRVRTGIRTLLLLIFLALFLDGSVLRAALEQRDGRVGRRASVELREEEVAGDEEDTEGDDDTKVAPEMTVLVTKGQKDVAIAVDGSLCWHGADGGTHLVLQCNVLVSWTLGNEG